VDTTSSLLAVVALSLSLSAKSEPVERPNPSIDPPKIVQAPLEPAIAESLSALVEEMKASRRERRIIEERWWPPSASLGNRLCKKLRWSRFPIRVGDAHHPLKTPGGSV